MPGYIGARSVKWLGRIIVRDRPSTNHYVASAYKHLAFPGVVEAVHERRRAQGVIAALVVQVALRDPAQLVVDDRHEPVQRATVARAQ